MSSKNLDSKNVFSFLPIISPKQILSNKNTSKLSGLSSNKSSLHSSSTNNEGTLDDKTQNKIYQQTYAISDNNCFSLTRAIKVPRSNTSNNLTKFKRNFGV